MRTTIYFAAGLFAALSATAATAAPIPIDLSTWSEQGNPANGSWTVAPGGGSVFQSINGEPTFFVSPNNFINTQINGSFSVSNAGDNDYIGFVFGYQSPLSGDPNNDYDFFLFDWKQGNQNDGIGLASEGFNLSRVSGEVNGFSPFWAHNDATQPDADFDVIDTDYGPTRGWETNVTYNFTLLYQDDLIRIGIEGGSGDFASGQTIFDITPAEAGVSNFDAGRFGFYNYSQAGVTYQGFTEEDAPPTDPTNLPEPGMLALLGCGLIGLVVARRRKV